MKVTKTSILNGQPFTMELNITPEELYLINQGRLVSAVAAHLSLPEREFLISGITPEEWENEFGHLDEEED